MFSWIIHNYDIALNKVKVLVDLKTNPWLFCPWAPAPFIMLSFPEDSIYAAPRTIRVEPMRGDCDNVTSTGRQKAELAV
jgi:hypothetical protein